MILAPLDLLERLLRPLFPLLAPLERLLRPLVRLLQRLGLAPRRIVEPAGLAIPLEDYAPGVPLFPQLTEIYRTTRNAFERFLRKLRGRGAARARERRREGIVNMRVGRNARSVRYAPGRNLLAPIPTLVNALRNGRHRVGAHRVRIGRSDLRGWDKVERESLTLVLLVDTSRSSHYYIEVFRQILRSLTGHFNRKRDRMGLVVLQGRQARVLNHPTHNFRVVTNSMGKLLIHGETPLADGLQKALAMVRIERFRNPGSLSLVVLLSDCCPEPVETPFEDIFASRAYRDALAAARRYRREGVSLLVINPACAPPDATPAVKNAPGERLSEMIVSAAGARLIKIHRRGEGAHFSNRQVDLVLDGIEAAFQKSRGGRLGQQVPGQGIGMVIE